MDDEEVDVCAHNLRMRTKLTPHALRKIKEIVATQSGRRTQSGNTLWNI